MVLPQPDSPTSPTHSPGSMLSEKSSTAVTKDLRVENWTCRSLTESSGAMAANPTRVGPNARVRRAARDHSPAGASCAGAWASGPERAAPPGAPARRSPCCSTSRSPGRRGRSSTIAGRGGPWRAPTPPRSTRSVASPPTSAAAIQAGVGQRPAARGRRATGRPGRRRRLRLPSTSARSGRRAARPAPGSRRRPGPGAAPTRRSRRRWPSPSDQSAAQPSIGPDQGRTLRARLRALESSRPRAGAVRAGQGDRADDERAGQGAAPDLVEPDDDRAARQRCALVGGTARSGGPRPNGTDGRRPYHVSACAPTPSTSPARASTPPRTACARAARLGVDEIAARPRRRA